LQTGLGALEEESLLRKLITTDSHLAPPPWLLKELPERLRDKVPGRFLEYEEREGKGYVVFPKQLAARMAEHGMPTEFEVDSEEMLVKLIHLAAMTGVDATPYFDPVGRLKDMERENVVAAVMCGDPVIGFTRGPEEVEAQIAYCRVVNDWLAETYKDHLGQFAPGIHLPFLDPSECATELERAADLGLRPALLPHGIWDDPYHQAHWEALWEVAADKKVPITLHIGGARDRPAASAEGMGSMSGNTSSIYAGATLEGFFGQSCSMGQTLIQFTLSGVLHKYPDLHVVCTEGYGFWLAGLMQFCDHLWEGRYSDRNRDQVQIDHPPSYYMKRQAHATFMWDPVAIRNRDLTGTDCLMWGNDYPHPEGLFPDSQAFVEKQFAGVPEEDIERLTYSNAKDLFRFVL
jgi:predicted TIM-barrel fold metal-dependent hydrolase